MTDHRQEIDQAIDAAIADDGLSRLDLRELLEEAQYKIEAQLSALDEDDKRDASPDGEE
jgi:hypothetical protein